MTESEREGPAAAAAAPLRLTTWAAGAGLLAALLVVNSPHGLGHLLVLAAIAGALLPGLPLDGWTRGYVALGCALAAMVLLRDAEWLLVLDALAIAALGTWVLVPGRTFGSLFSAGLSIWARLVRAPRTLLRPLAPLGPQLRPGLQPALRATVLTGALLAVFGALFASADMAFAEFANDAVPDVSLGLVPVRVGFGLFIALLVGAGWAARSAPLTLPRVARPARPARWEWLVPLVALNALFAVFVAIQLTVLFGGRRHVLTTAGLGYAEYARSGFWQLLVAAGLTLGVIAAAVHWGRPETARDRAWARALLGLLCAFTIVVLASALRRLDLYEDAYGLTRLRLIVHTTLLWFVALFGLVAAAGALWRARWLPRAAVASAGIALLALNVANPDALIAERAVDRWRDTGKVDAAYLSTLSADAVPALVQLPGRLGECALGEIAPRLAEGDSRTAYNRSRERARTALDRRGSAAPGCA